MNNQLTDIAREGGGVGVPGNLLEGYRVLCAMCIPNSLHKLEFPSAGKYKYGRTYTTLWFVLGEYCNKKIK